MEVFASQAMRREVGSTMDSLENRIPAPLRPRRRARRRGARAGLAAAAVLTVGAAVGVAAAAESASASALIRPQSTTCPP
jgi:ferric-dicitrate binding protein FerR (iron transport regulator)